MTEAMAEATAEAQAMVERLGLIPHPEGGSYRELHRSGEQVRRCRDDALREGLTLIAYLLRRDEVSRWHRVRGSDEIWYHGAGAPLDLWTLPPQGGEASRCGLGPLSGAGEEDAPVRVVSADWWQAARSRGAWSLVYCSVGPGFAFADFELLTQTAPGLRLQGAVPELL